MAPVPAAEVEVLVRNALREHVAKAAGEANVEADLCKQVGLTDAAMLWHQQWQAIDLAQLNHRFCSATIVKAIPPDAHPDPVPAALDDAALWRQRSFTGGAEGVLGPSLGPRAGADAPLNARGRASGPRVRGQGQAEMLLETALAGFAERGELESADAALCLAFLGQTAMVNGRGDRSVRCGRALLQTVASGAMAKVLAHLQAVRHRSGCWLQPHAGVSHPARAR